MDVTDSLTVAQIATCGPMATICVPIGGQITPEEPTAGDENIRPEIQAQILDEHFGELATLDVLAYDLRRREIAKNLDIRLSTLDFEVGKRRPQTADGKQISGSAITFDAIEPWHEPVNGEAIFNEVRALIQRHVVMTVHQAVAAALWVENTYLDDIARAAAILGVRSEEKRSGKTTLLALLSRIVPRPLSVSNASGAAIFRVIEKYQPTFIIDECDSFMRENEDIRGILNAGHTRDTAYVLRLVGDGFEERKFSTFGFKVLGYIGHLHGTVEDREIQITLRRRAPDEARVKLRDTDPAVFTRICRQLARFANDNRGKIKAARPQIPEALDDRAADSWELSFAIADAAGSSWAELARASALALADEIDDSSVGIRLLSDIRALFNDRRVDRFRGSELIEELNSDPEGQWCTFNRGKPLSQSQLAKRLRGYEIASGSVRFDDKTAKGYTRKQFEGAFKRYLRPFQVSEAAQRHNPTTARLTGGNPPGTNADLCRPEKPVQPNGGATCAVVPDEMSQSGADNELNQGDLLAVDAAIEDAVAADREDEL